MRQELTVEFDRMEWDQTLQNEDLRYKMKKKELEDLYDTYQMGIQQISIPLQNTGIHVLINNVRSFMINAKGENKKL